MLLPTALVAMTLWCGDLSVGARDLGCASTGAALLQRSVARTLFHFASSFVDVQIDTDESDESDPADEEDADEDIVRVPPHPPMAPIAPHAPTPPTPPLGPRGLRTPRIDAAPGGGPVLVREDSQNERPLPPFSEVAHGVPAVEVLHRIARTAGWSMTLVGVGQETIDVDLKDADPRDALRQVLQASHCMGVLRGDKLVVLPAPDADKAGTMIEQRGRRTGPSRKRRAGNDIVKMFQGDVTVPAGTVLHGDAVAIGGSIEVEQGAVVEGNTVAILGSVQVDNGGVVLGDGVAVLGGLEVERGGQVLGEHVQVGMGKLLGGRARAHRGGRSFFSRLGPFGFFPTLALFALVYLCGLFALRTWPDRVRAVSWAILGQPVRSFFIGFLCWLLLLPLAVLLCVSVVGIPLVPLLPLGIFLSIALGLSAVALRIGEALPAGPGQSFVPPAALGMGIAVLLLVSFVPLIGVSLLALAQFFALGGAVGSRFGRALPPH